MALGRLLLISPACQHQHLPLSSQNAARLKNKPIHSQLRGKGTTHWLHRLWVHRGQLRKVVKQKRPFQEELCASEAVAAAWASPALHAKTHLQAKQQPAGSAKMWAASHMTAMQMDLCIRNYLRLAAN